MNRIVFSALPVFLFFTSCSIQTEISPGPAATRAAIVKGEVGIYLRDVETKALDAERKQNWSLASGLYNDAGQAAAAMGQLQKAVSYRSKALHLAQEAKDQAQIVRALDGLATIHRTLRQYEIAREWTEKGIEATEKLPPGLRRAAFEGFFYSYLGEDLFRRGDLQKAIEYLAYAVQVQESRLGPTAKSRNPDDISNSVTFAVGSLVRLAKAYQQSRNNEEAIKAYQRGLDHIMRFKVRTSSEQGVYQGLGQVYLSLGDFAKALETSTKALALAEAQRNPVSIGEASRLTAEVYRKMGKTAQAMPYFQRAIGETESTRSLLQSEAYRQSFFEGRLDSYISMVGVLIESGQTDDAFGFGERARSRAFLDLVGSKAQLSRLKGDLLEEERLLQEQIAGIRARLSREADRETNRSDLEKGVFCISSG